MKTKFLAMAICGFLLNACAFAGEQSTGQSESGFTFSWYSLIRPLGIATLSLVALTFVTGLLRKKLRREFLNIHLPLAIAAVVLGLSHGLLVLILYR
ncbi:MAG: hypothetical protein ACYSWQ_03785 [Planctomycetota bacterium]|jgi:DMSO/TMAO reductase YedYZ heme-binding membrane subunit